MPKNTKYALIALLLAILLGTAGGYWAIKKIRAKQNQEIRYEGKLTLAKEGVDAAIFKEAVLSGNTMDETIEKYDLVTRWGLADAEAAKMRIKEKFIVKINGRDATLSYQDKDKELGKRVLESLMNSFYAKEKIKAGLRSKM